MNKTYGFMKAKRTLSNRHLIPTIVISDIFTKLNFYKWRKIARKGLLMPEAVPGWSGKLSPLTLTLPQSNIHHTCLLHRYIILPNLRICYTFPSTYQVTSVLKPVTLFNRLICFLSESLGAGVQNTLHSSLSNTKIQHLK